MDVTTRLEPVLAIAAAHAADVDADARFPEEAVTALRESGLLGLTLPAEVGGLGGGPTSWWGCSADWRVSAARLR